MPDHLRDLLELGWRPTVYLVAENGYREAYWATITVVRGEE